MGYSSRKPEPTSKDLVQLTNWHEGGVVFGDELALEDLGETRSPLPSVGELCGHFSELEGFDELTAYSHIQLLNNARIAGATTKGGYRSDSQKLGGK